MFRILFDIREILWYTMNMSKRIIDLVPGDLVHYIGSGVCAVERIEQITKVTATQITTVGRYPKGEESKRYSRKSGRQIGGSGLRNIWAVTPEEISEIKLRLGRKRAINVLRKTDWSTFDDTALESLLDIVHCS